eukprot:512388_1
MIGSPEVVGIVAFQTVRYNVPLPSEIVDSTCEQLLLGVLGGGGLLGRVLLGGGVLLGGSGLLGAVLLLGRVLLAGGARGGLALGGGLALSGDGLGHLAGAGRGLLHLLGALAGEGADDAVGDAQAVERVVGGAVVAESSGEAERLGLAVVGAVGVDLGDGELDGGVIVGDDQGAGGVALAGDVEVDVDSLLVDGSDGRH